MNGENKGVSSELPSAVMVTGADGFVGRAVCEHLQALNRKLIRVVRAENAQSFKPTPGVETRVAGDLSKARQWGELLRGVDAIIHLANRAHVMPESGEDTVDAYRPMNVEATLQLAKEAAAYGVRRFVFVSSAKVFGEGREDPYNEKTPPAPVGGYACSKWEAEQALWQVCRDSRMELVVVRPPLVYGPGVKANFLALLQAVSDQRKLPLGQVRHNQRSLVFVGNLADFLCRCLDHPDAADKTLLVSDGAAVSSAELITRMAEAMGVPAHLFSVPLPLLRLGLKWLGKGAQADRLLTSFVIDASSSMQQLQWMPPYAMKDGLKVTAGWWSEHEA